MGGDSGCSYPLLSMISQELMLHRGEALANQERNNLPPQFYNEGCYESLEQESVWGKGKGVNLLIKSLTLAWVVRTLYFSSGLVIQNPRRWSTLQKPHLPEAVCSLETITMFLFTVTQFMQALAGKWPDLILE